MCGSHAGPGQLPDAGGGAAKRVAPDWKLVLGEAATDIVLLRVAPPAAGGGSSGGGTASSSPSRRDPRGGGRGGAPRQELLAVCEHSLFVVAADAGEIQLQRRLEYHPACCRAYALPPSAGAPDPGDGLLVATHTKALLVYHGPTLAWAARLEAQPVALAVAELGGVKGLIASLDDEGARNGAGAHCAVRGVPSCCLTCPSHPPPPPPPFTARRPPDGVVPRHRPAQPRRDARGRVQGAGLRRDGRGAPRADGGHKRRGRDRRGRGGGGARAGLPGGMQRARGCGASARVRRCS